MKLQVVGLFVPKTLRNLRFYIADMIGFARKALDYTAGLSKAEFLADFRTYDATLRNGQPGLTPD